MRKFIFLAQKSAPPSRLKDDLPAGLSALLLVGSTVLLTVTPGASALPFASSLSGTALLLAGSFCLSLETRTVVDASSLFLLADISAINESILADGCAFPLLHPALFPAFPPPRTVFSEEERRSEDLLALENDRMYGGQGVPFRPEFGARRNGELSPLIVLLGFGAVRRLGSGTAGAAGIGEVDGPTPGSVDCLGRGETPLAL